LETPCIAASIRKVAELPNETDGSYVASREVIREMVGRLFVEEDAVPDRPSFVRRTYHYGAGARL
jgi:hypothetical protein